MKPVPDLARYKRLSQARQETLFKWLSGDAPKKIRPLSYKAASAKVKKEWGVKLSVSQLVDFYSWFPSQQTLREAKDFRSQIKDFLADNPDLNLESDRVLMAGQIIFEKEAIARRDDKLFMGLRRLRQKDLDQAMDRDRFEVESVERFLKWYSMVRMRELADTDMPHANKIAAMRKVAFQDVDALEKSGAVKLPPAA